MSAAHYSLSCFLFKFLQDTLDTLFGILDESSQRYGLKVFDSLVSTLYFDILSVLDQKLDNFWSQPQ